MIILAVSKILHGDIIPMQRIKSWIPIAVGALLGALSMEYLGHYARSRFPGANWYLMFAVDIITFMIVYTLTVFILSRLTKGRTNETSM